MLGSGDVLFLLLGAKPAQSSPDSKTNPPKRRNSSGYPTCRHLQGCPGRQRAAGGIVALRELRAAPVAGDRSDVTPPWQKPPRLKQSWGPIEMLHGPPAVPCGDQGERGGSRGTPFLPASPLSCPLIHLKQPQNSPGCPPSWIWTAGETEAGSVVPGKGHWGHRGAGVPHPVSSPWGHRAPPSRTLGLCAAALPI